MAAAEEIHLLRPHLFIYVFQVPNGSRPDSVPDFAL
jgi:hypothetical protein